MAQKSTPQIYQLKVTLIGSKPPIWRRLLVPGSISLAKLHAILQIAMGWTESHLHQFIAYNQYYGQPEPEYDFDVIDERKVRLDQLLQSEKDAITYEYDFGDSWEHKIVLEKILPFDAKATLPVCIKGKRACPPEDVGGVWGYADFLQAINDPKHPNHEEFRDWIGDDFDPEEFDLDEINDVLAKLN